jgi:hypothetical protein
MLGFSSSFLDERLWMPIARSANYRRAAAAVGHCSHGVSLASVQSRSLREHDRFGAAVTAGDEQFERAAPSGGRDALAVAWVAYEGHQAVLTRA